MQDFFLKGLYRFFSVTFIASFLVMQTGGCKINQTDVDIANNGTTTITSTFNPENTETTDICEEKTTSSDTDTTVEESKKQ